MTSFAETTDLNVNLDATGKQQRALDRATDLIRGALDGQTITLVEDDVVTVPGTGRRLLALPQAPIVSIASVVVDGVALVEDVNYRAAKRAAWLERLGCDWPLRCDVVVTYSHGYDTIPDDLMRLCASIADRILDGKINVRSEAQSAGGVQKSITYAASSDTLFSDAENAILDRYRLVPLP